MNKMKKQVKHTPLQLLRMILIFLLAILLIVFLARLADELKPGYSYEYSELLREAEDRDFPELSKGYYRDSLKKLKTQQDVSGFEAIVRCYDAGMLGKAYSLIGDVSNAEKQENEFEKFKTMTQDGNLREIIDSLPETFGE